MLSIIPGAADFTAANLQKGRKIRAFFAQFWRLERDRFFVNSTLGQRLLELSRIILGGRSDMCVAGSEV
jgi:hypothetical protein